MTLYFDFKKIYEKFKKLSTFFEEVESVTLLIKLIDVIIHIFLQSKKGDRQYPYIKNIFAKHTYEYYRICIFTCIHILCKCVAEYSHQDNFCKEINNFKSLYNSSSHLVSNCSCSNIFGTSLNHQKFMKNIHHKFMQTFSNFCDNSPSPSPVCIYLSPSLLS